MLGDEDRAWIDNASEADDTIELHHSLGQHLRNTWGLWHNSTLKADLSVQFGIIHPDDLSGYILKAYWHYRQGLKREANPTAWDRLRN